MRNNASYFYHFDGLGSTKALTDGNQNIQSTTIYDAWGNVLQASGTISNPYLYVGELGYYADGDAGMYLLTQRWYNPVIGRFVVKDPRGRAPTRRRGGRTGIYPDITPYMYGADNPSNTQDPQKFATIQECLQAYNECIQDAKADYNRCICEIESGVAEAHSTSCTYFCAVLCGGVCGYAFKDPTQALLCTLACGAACYQFCIHQSTEGWWVADLAKYWERTICGRLFNEYQESCHLAFMWCRQRIHRAPH